MDDPIAKKKQYRKALVLLSPGMNSTVALFMATQMADDVIALTIEFRYAEISHAAENNLGIVIGNALVKRHELLHLPADTLTDNGAMCMATMLMIAANRAVEHDCTVIIVGSTETTGDDRLSARLLSARALIRFCIEQHKACPDVVAPLLHIDNVGTARHAQQIPDALHALAYTWDCTEYLSTGNIMPCGKCDACVLRAKGFEGVGIPDPLILRLEREQAEAVENNSTVTGRIQAPVTTTDSTGAPGVEIRN